jgi:hypothetical protein
MSSADFAEMAAYYKIDPFGEERADWRAALTPYVLQLLFGKKKGRKVKFENYLFSAVNKPRVVQSQEQMQSTLKRIASIWSKRGNH